MKRWADRERDLRRVLRWVERGSPRLAMFGMVSLTAAAGFLTSVLLLHGGVDRMALRWLVGAAVAYAIFLVLLRVWLAVSVGFGPPDHLAARAAGRALDAVANDPVGAVAHVRDLAHLRPELSSVSLQLEVPSSPPGSSLPDLDLDLEGGLVLLVAAVLAGLAAIALVVSAWLVWIAPSLLAELALDATMGAVLFRSLRGSSPVREPWGAALKHTWGPALVVTLVMVSGALVLEAAVPGARSIREVAHRVLTPDARREDSALEATR